MCIRDSDQWIQHPDVREGFTRDLYVSVFPAAMSATGHGNAAGQLRQSVLESDDEALPVDLSERTDRIVRDREWAKEAS